MKKSIKKLDQESFDYIAQHGGSIDDTPDELVIGKTHAEGGIMDELERLNSKVISEFTKYTKENFNGFIFNWNWELTIDGWQINKFSLCCPKDETPLIPESSFCSCPNCKERYYSIANISDARFMVEFNIKQKYGLILV